MKHLGWLILSLCLAAQGEGAVVLLGGPNVVIATHQPIQAVVVDGNGNTFEQTVCYDPAIGGVNLNTAWAGPNASVYFPAYSTGYLWHNGYWVDQSGAYWDGGHRVYVAHADWNGYWAGYWHGHPHGSYYTRPNVSVHVHESIHNNYYHGGHGGHEGHSHHH